MNLFKKSNYKEKPKEYEQNLSIYNPTTRKFEDININDYLNSFNNLEPKKEIEKQNLNLIKTFRNGVNERINYINKLQDELKQYDPDFEKIKKYKRILKELETQDTQGEK